MTTFQKPYIIVLGNEKGGTGKSTLSMHIITHLLQLQFKVGSIDVDARQGTLTRYIENRCHTVKTKGIDLLLSQHYSLFKSTHENQSEAEADETERFSKIIHDLSACDFIVIDTPGSDSFLSRLAHSYAHTLITPLNDSFIDLDMLARGDSGDVFKPSTYSEMVWDQKKRRLMRGDRTVFDWIVVRNRLSHLNAHNKEEMRKTLIKLSDRLGFRAGEGFGERVIFRALFLSGITLLDLNDMGVDLSLSHVAAKQELRVLLELLRLPVLNERLKCAS